jgi:ribonucleoside-diphosphate reductase alpha chain
MVCLDLDHSEIVEFVNWKVEEEESRCIDLAGYASDYEGEAYKQCTDKIQITLFVFLMNF